MEDEYEAFKRLSRAAKEKARNKHKTDNNKKKAEELKSSITECQNMGILDILNRAAPVPMKKQPKLKASDAVVSQPNSSASSSSKSPAVAVDAMQNFLPSRPVQAPVQSNHSKHTPLVPDSPPSKKLRKQ